MYTITVTPRLGDIDFLGHVNNVVPSNWFELARTNIMRIFVPDLNLKKETWPLILAHTDYDFTDQIFLQDVEIRTWISRVGTKSFTVAHEAWQDGRLCIKGTAVIVYYDFNAEKTIEIPPDKKQILSGI